MLALPQGKMLALLRVSGNYTQFGQFEWRIEWRVEQCGTQIHRHGGIRAQEAEVRFGGRTACQPFKRQRVQAQLQRVSAGIGIAVCFVIHQHGLAAIFRTTDRSGHAAHHTFHFH